MRAKILHLAFVSFTFASLAEAGFILVLRADIHLVQE